MKSQEKFLSTFAENGAHDNPDKHGNNPLPIRLHFATIDLHV